MEIALIDNSVVFPEKIVVGNTTYKLTMDKQTFLEQQVEMEMELYGVTCFEEQMIVIAPDMEHDITCRILLHELGHAGWFEAGIQGFTTEEEEMIVHQMSTMWLAIIRNNPELMEYIK